MLMILLFFTGLFAGTIDAIAGGGGLITIPMLLSIGMPPHLVFGTNKLQGMLGTSMATFKFYKHGWISFKNIYHGLIASAIGAILGAILAQVLSTAFLSQIIPILLVAILIYTIFSPKLGHIDSTPKIKEFSFYLIFGFIMGAYDGFFGPATGSFWVFLLTYFMGYNLIKATAYTKVFNLNSSLIAMVCFAIGNNIDYKIGLCMAAGQLIGGRLGASLAMKKGAQIIRPIFLIIVTLTIATLVAKNYAHADFVTHFTHQYGIVPSIMLAMALLISATIFFFKIRKKQKAQI